ncbi:TolC family protein [Lentimicrobium sp. S6]|uniref:TolC family protein n=1 Tax=Lentimicrobium sp. S6 TaxID=2735872 RepID=UPI001557BE67|nr:TolC family protein [Lentimicrobium sp. S6]NPD47790.1 TolC family protein [Lentimicrobium sp. S6]
MYRITIFFENAWWFILASFILTLLWPTSQIQAQESWKISDCIDYAMENNLDLNMKYNNIESQEVSLKESKANILPNLNFGSNLELNFGRNVDGNDNSVTYDPTLSQNYYLNSSFTLFQGMVKKNGIRFSKYLLKASEQGAEVEKNQLVFKILSSYYTVLYSQGLRDVAESQVGLSKMQFDRMQKLVEVGKESPITAQDLESQWASDRLSLTKAQNQYNKTILELKQLLRLNVEQSFAIDTNTTQELILNASNNVDSIFIRAKDILPQLKQQQMLLGASEKNLAIAKGGVYPSLNMNAGYSTGFYDQNSLTYGKQLEENQNQWVGLSLRVPIYNRAVVSSDIKRKRIALKDQKLLFEKQKEALYIEIWNAIEDLQSAEKEYQSSQELHDFSELSLKNVTKKLEKGLANTTEFETAKQRYISAQANLLKSKLVYVMRYQMLTFYQTANWNHLY